MKFKRPTRIDETNVGDHWFLNADDECYFYGEYFSGTGYQGGDTNQLVANYKIKPTTAYSNARRKHYKEAAIQEIANGLRSTLSSQGIEGSTWVPIPTSKIPPDPDYDDRLVRTLALAFRDYDSDVRSLIVQGQSVPADHERSERISPDELNELLAINRGTLADKPLREKIVLFDDVLTTGKHFKCCQRILREAGLTDTRIIGVFIARRIPANPFEDFEVLDSL